MVRMAPPGQLTKISLKHSHLQPGRTLRGTKVVELRMRVQPQQLIYLYTYNDFINVMIFGHMRTGMQLRDAD